MLLSVHGFALRASPAVKHGVSPLGTVGEHAMSLGRGGCYKGVGSYHYGILRRDKGVGGEPYSNLKYNKDVG